MRTPYKKIIQVPEKTCRQMQAAKDSKERTQIVKNSNSGLNLDQHPDHFPKREAFMLDLLGSDRSAKAPATPRSKGGQTNLLN